MDRDRWKRIEAVFDGAGQRAPEELDAWLDEACGGDSSLRREVESLLAAEPDREAFLETPIVTTMIRGDRDEPAARLVGSRVGAYDVTEVIASGGMGVVYQAVQRNPRRTVALKVMKLSVASRSSVRRFQYESEFLARLRHPGIAQVFEAGVHDEGDGGVPYFAMEYVPQAATLIAYAAAHELGTRRRLELFAQVCDAVHHGHQRGIIHRDLKPGNILVDPSGSPKVIDFGVARATGSDVAVTTQQTDIGELIGTMQYMSPEQCDADPHEIDVRSDVYAMGVVLYELLTGQLPYVASSATIYQATRTIKEAEPRRLSAINPRLRGDVETIVLKALQKERDQRYQSVAEMATDIRHYLNREPIAARPPSATYRVARFVSRYRWQTVSVVAAATVVVAVALILVIMGLLIETRHARDQHEDARKSEQQQRQRADALARGMAFESAEAALQIDDAVTARSLLDRTDLDRQSWVWRHLRGRCDASDQLLSGELEFPIVTLSPDRRRLAGACRGTNAVWLWDMSDPNAGPIDPTPERILRYQAMPTARYRGLAISPDGRWVVGSCFRNVDPRDNLAEVTLLVVWALDSGDVVTVLEADSEGEQVLDFSPDGSLLAAITTPSSVTIWDSATWIQRSTWPAHDRNLQSLAFSPDGSLLATGSTDYSARLWSVSDPDHPVLMSTLRGHEYHVAALAFHPGGKALATGSQDGTIRLWDVQASIQRTEEAGDDATGVQLASLELGESWVASLDFSPDGRHLVVGGGDRVVRICRVELDWPLWDIPLRRRSWSSTRMWEARRLVGHADQIRTVGFVRGGEAVVSATAAGEIKVWHAGADSRVPVFEGHFSSVHAVQFDPRDPRFMASGGGAGTVRLWDVVRGEQVLAIDTPYPVVAAVDYHPRRPWVAAASHEALRGSITIWDLGHVPPAVHAEIPHNDAIYAMAFDDDGSRLAWAGGYDGPFEDGSRGAVFVKDVDSERAPMRLTGHMDSVTGVAFGFGGRQLVSGSLDGTVRLWDVETGACRIVPGNPGVGVLAVAVDPLGRWVASGSTAGAITLWDAATLEPIHVLSAHTDAVTSLDFDPDGLRLASGSQDTDVKIWDPVTGALFATLRDHPGFIKRVRWSPDGERLASAASGWQGMDNTVRLWEAEVPPAIRRERAEATLARERVQLDVARLFQEHDFVENVIEAIARTPRFTGDAPDAAKLHAAAEHQALVYGEDPWWRLGGCWRAARRAGGSRATYATALELSRSLYEANPVEGRHATASGMALYRVDRWAEAVDRLETALMINGDNPTDVAFLAMALARLGREAEAQAVLGRLRGVTIALTRIGSADDEIHALLEEAAVVVGAPAVESGRSR